MRKWLNNPFLKGSFIFTLTSFVVSILNYLVNLLVAKHFSLIMYGEYMTSLAYFGLFATPISALTMILVKRLGSIDKKQRYFYISNLRKYLISQFKKYFWTILFLTIVLFWFFSIQSKLLVSSAIFIILMTAINLITALYNSSLQIFKKFLTIGLILISVSVIKIIGIELIIYFKPSLQLLYLVLLLAIFFNFLFVKKYVDKLLRINKSSNLICKHQFEEIKYYLKKKTVLIPFFTTLGMVSLISIDIMLAKIFLDGNQAGLYAGLSLLAKIILYFTAPIMLVAYSFFSSKENSKYQNKNLVLSIIIFLFIGSISLFLYKNFAELIINMILGEKFISIAPIIWLAALFGLLYSLANLLAQFIITKNSWFGLSSILIAISQLVLISLFHKNIMQVMQINVFVIGILLLIYSSFIIHNYQRFK